MNIPDPFDWWEYDTAGTQVLPLVVGPEIPYIPVSETERCEMAAYEALARMEESEANVCPHCGGSKHG